MSNPELERSVESLVDYHIARHGGIRDLLIMEGYEAIVFERGPLLESMREWIKSQEEPTP